MEETQTALRASQPLLLEMRDARAMEKLSRHPQLMGPNQLKATVEKPAVGGGEAGLKRVVGRGRGRPPMTKVPNRPAESVELRDDADDIREHAEEQGKRLASELHQIRGGAYMKHFMKGMGYARSRSSSPGSAPNTLHGGIGVLPDIEPGYGNPPQAPASFERNTVGMGKAQKKMMKEAKEMAEEPKAMRKVKLVKQLEAIKARRMGDMARDVEQAKVEGSGKVDKRKMRGSAISRLMKEKGMTLGEASKYVKEHGM